MMDHCRVSTVPVPSLLILVVLLVIGSGCADSCLGQDRIPVPPWMEPELVAGNMVINGLPSTVHRFSVQKSVNEVLAYYRSRWAKNERGVEPGYALAVSKPWVVVSRIERKRYLLTVQVRSTGPFEATGFLAQADMKRVTRPDKTKDIPMVKGSKVLNDVVSYDPGQKGRTLLITNKQSIQANSTYYKTYYSDRNWALVLDQKQNKGHVLFFQRAGQEAKVVVNALFGVTQVVINTVDRD